MTASILDEVSGIGPIRKKALLKHFKSLKNLREASLDEIRDSNIVPDEVAKELKIVLDQYNRGKVSTDDMQGALE